MRPSKNFLIAGLRRGSDFWKSLQAKEPETLAELYQQAEPFKRLEISMANLEASHSRGSYRFYKQEKATILDPRRKEKPLAPRRYDRGGKERSPPPKGGR